MFEKMLERSRRIRPEAATKAFIRHNRSVWGQEQRTAEREVLFEFNGMASAVIAYSYLANVLAKFHDATIKAYIPARQGRLARILPTVRRRIYQSFNTTEVFSVALSSDLEAERDAILSGIPLRDLSKADLVDLVVDGIHIGDLVYDEHLRKNSVPTVDSQSESFSQTLRESIELFVFWRHYLDTHDVRAVNVSHCVYNYGIILRLAVVRDIPVYQISATHGYRLSKTNLWAYDEFYDYPARFAKLGPDVRALGLNEAGERLERRFSGEIGVDMHYSSKSAYGQRSANRVIDAGPRTKVFVALHCFFDNPHPYGLGYFSDFHEWLTFLGEISLNTDYDWYLKTHPDFLPGNTEVIESFLKRYQRFKLIPSDTSHHQIISEGIDVVLTVHGTVGFEYAALGVPVVNASPCNPHIGYNFNMHPRSLKEYRETTMNLGKVRMSIDPTEVREYYYMRNIRTTQDWLLGDYDGFLNDIGGFRAQFTSKSYSWFLSHFTPEGHGLTQNSLSAFVESGEYCFDVDHVCML